MKGYRTILFNAIMATIAILSQFGLFGDATVPDAGAVNQGLDVVDAIFTAFWGIGNVGLRMVTNTAVGKAE